MTAFSPPSRIQIANKMGVQRNAILGKCNRLGIPVPGSKRSVSAPIISKPEIALAPPVWDDDKIKRLRALKAKGLSWADIARELWTTVGAAKCKFASIKAGEGTRRARVVVKDGYPDLIPEAQTLPSQDGDYWAFYSAYARQDGTTGYSRVYCFFVPLSL